jgi:hypothetical protein
MIEVDFSGARDLLPLVGHHPFLDLASFAAAAVRPSLRGVAGGG